MSIGNLFKNPKYKNHRDDSDEEEREIKRPKKEVYKPWGKKERLLVLSVLLVSILSSAILGISSRDWKLPGIPRLTFPKSFLGEETYVIEKKTDGKAIATSQEKIDQTISAFKNKTDHTSGVWGLYVMRISNKVSYGVNEKETFPAASLIKLPLLATLYKEAQAGRIDLATKYKLRDSDKIPGSGSLFLMAAGTEFSFRQLAELMGHESDNTAFGIIRGVLGDTKINTTIEELGMKSTSLSDNETTPEEIGKLLAGIYLEEIVSKKSSQEILDYLTNTIYEDWLVAGIPKGIRVAHKFGREIHVVNDAGVVQGPKPFIVVIMSKGVVEKEANEIFPSLAKIIYDAEK